MEMLFDTAEPFLCIIAAFLSIKIMMGKICTINCPIYDQNLHHKFPIENFVIFAILYIMYLLYKYIIAIKYL